MNWIWWILAYIFAGLIAQCMAAVLVILASYTTPMVDKEIVDEAMDKTVPDYSKWPKAKFIFWYCVDILAWPISALVAAVIMLNDIKNYIIRKLQTVED